MARSVGGVPKWCNGCNAARRREVHPHTRRRKALDVRKDLEYGWRVQHLQAVLIAQMRITKLYHALTMKRRGQQKPKDMHLKDWFGLWLS